ncbi:MAG TPA: 3-hydroxyacyl-CoA dehydrogenase NAD-binding domain-containing protein [Anaeromyxobacteraceae bacterium]|nr:3-hydroxyacyl-CoA dehydrogenase NAD-binding domain-containing protein [Anaeromyxobacteraceae bacterium]
MERIEKVAVLGAGVMGGTIAAHLANAGLDVLLLDVVTPSLDALRAVKPAALFVPSAAARIRVGTFADDAARLRDRDWVIEVVVERMDVKRKLLAETVAPNLGPAAILTTNTSGLSVNALAEALPEPLRRRFLVTHFFNPPRYMRLLEIVASRHTDPAVVAGMAEFLSRRLGKGIVFGKDTPNFIANRIGVYSICNAVRHMLDLGLTVEEVDAVAGTATARPRSAAFGTADLVGLDTLRHVAANSFELLPGDDERDVFRLPPFVDAMVEQGLLGNKAKAGFFKKVKGPDGTARLQLDPGTGGYVPTTRPKLASVEAAKGIDDPAARLQAVLAGSDKAAQFAWRNLRDTLLYAFKRIPEIADDVVNVDNAMRWGFNWELGPFEMLDAIGVARFVERAVADGVAVPPALRAIERFYRVDGAARRFTALDGSGEREVPRPARAFDLALLKRNGALIERTPGASILSLGDGVLGLEFHTKMNAIGGDVLATIVKAVKRAEAEGVALVVANQGPAFSAGANLALLAAGVAEGAWDEIALMVRNFQKATMALKLSRVPVVAAPHGLALGGGCEVCLHSAALNPHAETYMGLVEVGVGLLPAGGGTKELALRAVALADQYETDVSPFVFKHFLQIATARVSASAAELASMAWLRPGDAFTMNSDELIHDAKQRALALAGNYRPPAMATEVRAPGRSVAASIRTQLWNLREGGFISEHDEKIGRKVAEVITGGDVPAGTPVTEAYLLDLEREAFLSLCGERRTLERIQHMLKKGKPLRN